MNFLYKNFLDDKRIYTLNENYYKQFFKKLTLKTPSPSYQTSFRNGEKFYDGNPIFSTQYDNRLVRIIQEEPESEKPYINAIIEDKDEKGLKELIVFLELSKEVKPYLEMVIKKWLIEQLSKGEMETFIKTVEELGTIE